MTKISLLKADILRMHLAFKELTDRAATSIMKDLDDWHSQLPPQMLLANIARDDLPFGYQLSIFHAHLLYLGAVILLYRRIASQFVQSFGLLVGSNVQRAALWDPSENTFLNQMARSVMAAKHSARILGLLMDKHGIFKRCWLVM
jgi:hypothetical protein